MGRKFQTWVGGAALAIGALGILGPFHGCQDARVKSPVSGRLVAADELQADAALFQAQQAAEAKAAELESAEALRKAKAQSERDAALAQRAAAKSLRQLNANAEEVQEKLQDTLDQIGFNFNNMVESVKVEAAKLAEARSAYELEMQSKFDAAVADINRQNEQRSLLLKGLQSGTTLLATAVPGAAPFSGLASTLLGLVVGGGAAGAVGRIAVSRVTKNTEKIVDSIDIAREKSQKFDEAFKEVADTLKTYQGDAASSLVSRLQQHS